MVGAEDKSSKIKANTATKEHCDCSFCRDTVEFLSKPNKPRFQIMSVIVGADGATRGMGTPDWTVPIMICVETCVFPF